MLELCKAPENTESRRALLSRDTLSVATRIRPCKSFSLLKTLCQLHYLHEEGPKVLCLISTNAEENGVNEYAKSLDQNIFGQEFDP